MTPTLPALSTRSHISGMPGHSLTCVCVVWGRGEEVEPSKGQDPGQGLLCCSGLDVKAALFTTLLRVWQQLYTAIVGSSQGKAGRKGAGAMGTGATTDSQQWLRNREEREGPGTSHAC